MLYAVGNRVSHSEKTNLILDGKMRRLIIILAKVGQNRASSFHAQAGANCSSQPRACGELVNVLNPGT